MDCIYSREFEGVKILFWQLTILTLQSVTQLDTMVKSTMIGTVTLCDVFVFLANK